MKDAVLHSYPWYVADWRGSETRLTLNSSAKYIFRELLDQMWIEGSIPDDMAAMARIAAVELKEFKAAWPSLEGKFLIEGGRVTHWRVLEKRPKLQGWANSRVKGGVTGGTTKARNKAKPVAIASRNLEVNPLPPLTLTLPSEDPPTPLFDLEAAFEELWDAYPAKGRTRKPMSQGYYVEAVATLPDDQQAAKHGAIVAPVLPGGKWAKSAQWAKGFVQGLSVYLNQTQWLESPEAEGVASTAGAYDHLPLGFTQAEKDKMARVERERAEDGLQ